MLYLFDKKLKRLYYSESIKKKQKSKGVNRLKKNIKFLIVLLIVVFLYSTVNVYAEEVSTTPTSNETEETIEKETEEINNDDEKELASDTEVNEEENTNEENIQETEDVTIEPHKVAVITTKVDENGNTLVGATLQIIDNEGNIIDEWVSEETPHTSLLPEGEYILREVSAPEGYSKAEDQKFTVLVKENNIDAGVDFSETPCEHYGGTPLYYVESNGEKSEVYCINQGWETPDEYSKYDGNIVTPENIRTLTNQTVYVDAEQNLEKLDISDQSLSNEELYNKVLDVIYHRQQASETFSDLTEAEIRYVTEAALKNYTNAGLTRVQGVTKTSAIPEGVDDYYYDGRYYWYLYTHYRSFVYLPDAPLGKDIYKTVVGAGDAFGTLARHWNGGSHNAKNSEEVRSKMARYYDLYQYLVSPEEQHPTDMHLFVYSTNDSSSDPSSYNFDEGAYQNLIGIRWFNPYDENYKVELKCVNTEIIPPVTGIELNKTITTTNNSNNSYLYIISLSLLGLLVLDTKKRFN